MEHLMTEKTVLMPYFRESDMNAAIRLASITLYLSSFIFLIYGYPGAAWMSAVIGALGTASGVMSEKESHKSPLESYDFKIDTYKKEIPESDDETGEEMPKEDVKDEIREVKHEKIEGVSEKDERPKGFEVINSEEIFIHEDMKECPVCGSYIPQKSSVCPECGADLSDPNLPRILRAYDEERLKDSYMRFSPVADDFSAVHFDAEDGIITWLKPTTEYERCPFCGNTVRAGAEFCPHCGKKIKRDMMETIGSHSMEKVKVCPSCGAEFDDNREMCPLCGVPLQEPGDYRPIIRGKNVNFMHFDVEKGTIQFQVDEEKRRDKIQLGVV